MTEEAEQSRSVKNQINRGGARQDGRISLSQQGPVWRFTTGHVNKGGGVVLRCGKSCCCHGNGHCLDCGERNGWLFLGGIV